jgi:hypothetical protein
MGRATRREPAIVREVVCVTPGLTVVAGAAGRSFVPGDRVALDAAIAPGLTWAQAIGAHVEQFFAPVTPRAEGA